MIKKIFKILFSLSLYIGTDVFCSQTIYIYAGTGASKSSILHTEKMINHYLKENYEIKQILPEEIIRGGWEKKTKLLIIPGGADLPYAQALNGVGNKKIRAYVENGGAFLGICAGAYYSGNDVKFAEGTSMEVLGKRELSFFPGTVEGPTIAPYDYASESGARATQILWKDPLKFLKETSFICYYNGGGCFVDAATKTHVKILATYATAKQEAAIVECQVGLGKAILSGVHFEYDHDLLDANDIYLIKLIPQLKGESQQQRMQLIQHILERLNLNCSSPLSQLAPAL